MVVVIWAVAVVSGFGILAVYANRPGTAAVAPKTFRVAGKPKLMVFLHPECPCSRSTLEELDRVLASVDKDRVDASAYVYAPHEMGVKWAEGALYRRAKSIPGLRVELDWDGRFANSLDVWTSGQTMLYAANGHLAFSGGITASRGHEGDNSGATALIQFLRTGATSIHSTPVFGCSFGFRHG